jgi:hypothetical protein
MTDIKIPAGFAIPQQGYFILGNNDNRTTNGIVPMYYMYSPHVKMNETFGAVGRSSTNIVHGEVYWDFANAPPVPELSCV